MTWSLGNVPTYSCYSNIHFYRKLCHAREPLYSNNAVITCWLPSTSAQKVYLAVKKRIILVNSFTPRDVCYSARWLWTTVR